MVLIASFHYRKKNYHLVKLVEPIVVVGKRINDIKGYYFNLLDDKESAEVTPILEDLLLNQKYNPTMAVEPSSSRPNKGSMARERSSGTLYVSKGMQFSDICLLNIQILRKIQ